ncbi:hypothetical protein SNOG_20096 [Parastagonospora nodorum SN15]|uniref:Uncharacterized protein n=1 Tax=Phaeosphaeria nodorum (strain SN15 / ATCC MYA-4574 / FGSC 10173) TaxID=321614 RepID=A9JX93_PHANO|nr:hypothetical protein SNOG_20096 [Parastagonospora nodorum SN15]EDP89785.1 hypothetical protein SNOG_20096 [Parastagonospora nodorum SN15]
MDPDMLAVKLGWKISYRVDDDPTTIALTFLTPTAFHPPPCFHSQHLPAAVSDL